MMDYRVPKVVRDPSGQEPLRGCKAEDPSWKDICSFSVAPRKKFSFLQVCKLRLRRLRGVLNLGMVTADLK